MPKGPAWVRRAACIDADPELFFPTGWSSAVEEAAAETIAAYCDGCTVRAECLAYGALDAIPDGSIWGGMRRGSTGFVTAGPVCGSLTSYYRHKRLGLPVDERCQAAYDARLARNNQRRATARGRSTAELVGA